MAERGVEHVSYFQVDNPLVSVINPLFIGLHDLQSSDMSSRSLTKTGPFEKLGNFVSIGDRVAIIEYSDLPEEKALEKDGKGRIKYRAGSPAIHVLRRDFIEQFASGEIKLPYHRAEKKVPHLDEKGEVITSQEPNAVKFETFVFDALPLARNPLILEADRLEEFSLLRTGRGSIHWKVRRPTKSSGPSVGSETRGMPSRKTQSWRSAPRPLPTNATLLKPIWESTTSMRI